MTQEEFEHIATGMRSKISTQIRRIISGKEDIEDVASDTMLKLWALHEELEDAVHCQKLATVIAQHLAIDFQRKAKRSTNTQVRFPNHPETDGEETPDFQIPATDDSSPDARIEWKEDLLWLRERLQALPGHELQVLRMRQKERKSNAEIAQIMGIKETSVAVMLSAARKKLFNDIKNRYSR